MGTNAILNPDEVLQKLKAGAKSPRTARSLDIVYQVCKEQHERNSNDFSYGMIGKLSGERNGPTAQPIRNASGAVYRTLIDTWARFANGHTRRMPTPKTQKLDDDVLSLIEDPVARILVQSYLSENKKLRHENQVLKVAAKEKLVIDLSGKHDLANTETFTLISPLLDQEYAALRAAISPDTMRIQGWTVNIQTGAVTKGPLTVFNPGFVTAITKITSSVDGE